MAGVLDGIKVLDLSWGISGPMATMLMSDHGAQVTKIEPPGGDPFRSQSGYKAWNRGKRSAVLDLKDRADLQVLLKLVKRADVFVESFSPGVTSRLGIDYQTLGAINPGLVYCSITAYGRDSRHSDRPGYDALVAARMGMQWEHRGWPQGALARMAGRDNPYAEVEIPPDWTQGANREGPFFPASFFPSLGAFYEALTAISAAIRARGITGKGQLVEITLMQGAFAGACADFQRAENIDAPLFNTWILNSNAPKGHFEGSDGRWIHNWVPNPRFLISASQGDTLSSSPDLKAQNDPDRFGTGPEEFLVMSHYQPIMAECVRKFPAKAWVEAAAVAGMTIQEVRPPEEALTDPLMLADGCVTEIDDPDLGVIRQVGETYRLSKTPGRIQGPPPKVGQHTETVKAEADAIGEVAGSAAATGRKLLSPLEGIRVIDLGLAIAGPYGTQLLSDLGAEVIKVNALHDTYWHRNHIAYVANRGKRSIALNLKDPRAMKILHELVKTADIVQHNMRYDAAERLGVDYESLKKINPQLIYGHSRGHETGPRAPLPGNDQTAGALAGVQWEDGGMSSGGKPMWSLTSIGDIGNGFLSAIGLIQALYHRDRTGEGQMIDTSIVNAQLLACSYAIAYPDGRAIERPHLDAEQLGLAASYRMYDTAEGWLCVVIATCDHWDRLCRIPDFQSLSAEERFADQAKRNTNDAALSATLEAVFRKKNAAEWFNILDQAGVPCEICDPTFGLNLHEDAELIKKKWVTSYRQHYVGRLDQIGLLFSLSDTPGVIQGPPLIVGEQTVEIMTELGYSPTEIDALNRSGAISVWMPGVETVMPEDPWAKKDALRAAAQSEQVK